MKFVFLVTAILSLFVFPETRFYDVMLDKYKKVKEYVLHEKERPDIELTMLPDNFVANLDAEQQGMLSWTEMEPGINESLRYVRLKHKKDIAVGLVTWGDIEYSLILLKKLLPEIDKDASVLLDNFEWVKMHSEENPFFLTGYYHLMLEGSKTPEKGYVPLYAMPDDRKRGVPYHDRKAIVKGALAGRNLEIAWAKDPFEAFLLEVQGSGCLVFEDGTMQCLRYAGQNGHKYKSSRRILEENGLLMKSDITEQRKFFAEHPEYLHLLNENPSYVFFKKTNNSQAIGAMERPLKGWQSIAVDRKVIPLGSIVALGAMLPDKKSVDSPFYGLMLAQDTGGAIKQNRIDIFCGSSERAAYVAAKLDAVGPVWMLLAKDRPGKNNNVAHR